MCLALRASGLWLRYAALQNLIPSVPWIAPPHPPPWHNPRKGRDQIFPSGNLAHRGSIAITIPVPPILFNPSVFFGALFYLAAAVATFSLRLEIHVK